ncbi:hypothetical protein AWB76_07728 [Caballeronia temeraria]|uniref:Uncharacterized protein n=1 Tax=Caballeronia temeraria TaxID=1777137 RepID=A0A158DZ59_9BURK|nr:hypothetical protein AWB76_07728 [Caballeronia temeraria]
MAGGRQECQCCGFCWSRGRAGSAATYRFDSPEKVGSTHSCHQRSRELGYLAQRVGTCQIEFAGECHQVFQVDCLDGSGARRLHGELMTTIYIDGVANDENAALSVWRFCPGCHQPLLQFRALG